VPRLPVQRGISGGNDTTLPAKVKALPSRPVPIPPASSMDGGDGHLAGRKSGRHDGAGHTAPLQRRHGGASAVIDIKATIRPNLLASSAGISSAFRTSCRGQRPISPPSAKA